MKRLLVLVAVLLTGCAAPMKKTDFEAFHAAKPRSILIVPAVNKSLDVDAPDYLLTTLSVPLGEKGFYVFPVHTAKVVLQQEGFYEGEQIHQQPPEKLAKLFGADVVLYVTINRWDAKYAVFATTVTVDFDYKLVAKDGTEIWRANKQLAYSPQNQNAGHPLATLLAAAVQAALVRAKPDYMPLANMANYDVFVVGPTAIPNGPYLTVK